MTTRIAPTQTDLAIARTIARHTNPPTEATAQALTWGADEHVLCAFAAAWWLICRTRPLAQRQASNHLLVTAIAATALPHVLKGVFDQERPDRRTIVGHLNGVPLSGNALDAFHPATRFISARSLQPRPVCRPGSVMPYGLPVPRSSPPGWCCLHTGRATWWRASSSALVSSAFYGL